MSILKGGMLAVVGIATAVLMSFGASSAMAATCSVAPDRVFTVDIAGASCVGFGYGNIEGDSNDFSGYVFLDKWTRGGGDSLTGSNEEGILTASLTSGTAGSFAFTLLPGYTNYVLGFKSGGGPGNTNWAGFLLPNGTDDGNWSFTMKQALSHMNLYAQVAAVPVPAGVLLLGSALGGLGLFGWRNKRQAKLAA